MGEGELLLCNKLQRINKFECGACARMALGNPRDVMVVGEGI